MAVTASDSLRVLRIASVIEGATLLLLFLVAMPLKYVADTPLAVSIVGPIHGAAFLIYTALVLQSFVSRLISVTEVARLTQPPRGRHQRRSMCSSPRPSRRP